jgi:hypothetical protein
MSPRMELTIDNQPHIPHFTKSNLEVQGRCENFDKNKFETYVCDMPS